MSPSQVGGTTISSLLSGYTFNTNQEDYLTLKSESERIGEAEFYSVLVADAEAKLTTQEVRETTTIYRLPTTCTRPETQILAKNCSTCRRREYMCSILLQSLSAGSVETSCTLETLIYTFLCLFVLHYFYRY